MIIAELYPELSPEELKEAEYNLHRYFELAIKMAEKTDLKHATEDRDKSQSVQLPSA